MIRATVTSKGQITLPKPVRDALGLRKSTVVVFEIRDGEAVMRPAGRGFMDLFASIPPISRPEDFQKIKERAWEAAANEIMEDLA